MLAPNKSLAAQLASEFREFFPKNRVEYFVSYYDYYQPEAYLPSTDTYIEKDSSINDEIDRLRHSATSALHDPPRRDHRGVGVGDLRPRLAREVRAAAASSSTWARSATSGRSSRRLVELQYERNDFDFARNKFRVRGDTIEIFPAYEERASASQLFGDEVERIASVDPLTGEIVEELDRLVLFPASHYVTDRRAHAAGDRGHRGRAGRAARLSSRSRASCSRRSGCACAPPTTSRCCARSGVCSGIENYSRHLDGRHAGPDAVHAARLLPRRLPRASLDESHVRRSRSCTASTRATGRARTRSSTTGSGCPSAMDNRPLRFEEFVEKVNQVVFLSATPEPVRARGCRRRSSSRSCGPTGLIDPEVDREADQGPDRRPRRRDQARAPSADQRVLVTTLTKKMSEDLTDYLLELGIRVRYLHSEVDTLERVEILRSLRLGEFDVLVGINLLREGLDLPEVSLVAILDADKEGFLRSATSLIQTIGRAARNVDGQVIMYADQMTDSMRHAHLARRTAGARSSSSTTRSTASTRRPSARRSPTSSRWCAARDGDDDRPAAAGAGGGGAGQPQRSAVFDLADVPPDELGRLIQTLQEEMHDAAKRPALRGSGAPARRDHRAQARAPRRRLTDR